MTSIADNSIKIQTTSESSLSTPSWFGEVVLISSYLRKDTDSYDGLHIVKVSIATKMRMCKNV